MHLVAIAGRVGGLAVALGLGMAANSSASVATAAPDSPASSEGANSLGAARSQSAGKQQAREPGSPQAQAVELTPVSHSASRGTERSAKVTPLRITTSPGADRPSSAPTLSVKKSRSRSVISAQTNSPADQESTARSSAPPATHVPADSMVSGIVDPSPALQSNPDPLGPHGSAASWTLLAAARREVGVPGSAATTQDPRQAAAGLPRQSVSGSTLTLKDEIDIWFDGFNNSIGWIPLVGTVINGAKFAVDAASLAISVISFDLPQIVTEIGNLAVDAIGLVPVVGAPLASLIYQTLLGGNIKFGRLIQTSLQNYLDADEVWAKSQFRVESVEVSPGVFGSYAGIANVSTPTKAAVGIPVDITNNGFENNWSIPIEGRFALLALSF